MKIQVKNVILFIVILFLWLVSGFIFKIDFSYYNLLKLPVFTINYKIISIIWFIIYILNTISIIKVINTTNIIKNPDYLYMLITNYISNQLFLLFFFKLMSPFLGLAITIIIFISTIFLFIETKKINKNASYLLIPYLVYSTYALILMGSIYFMNF